MIRLAKTLLTTAAFALALTATAQASTITVAFNNQVGDDFFYSVVLDKSGPDLGFLTGDTLTISGLSGTFIATSPNYVSNPSSTDLFTVTPTATSVTFTTKSNSPFIFTANSNLTLVFKITAPGATLQSVGNWTASYTTDEATGVIAGSLPTVPLLVPTTEAPEPAAAPEPSTLALGLIGVAGLAVARRRMK